MNKYKEELYKHQQEAIKMSKLMTSAYLICGAVQVKPESLLFRCLLII